MSSRHFEHWPSYAARNLHAPLTSLHYNAEVSARRYPDKPFIIFYDTKISFAAFLDESERVAGFLEQRCGVRRGDRVLLLMQNSPQFMIGYYGILRANAVVVPLNPMNLTHEIEKYALDAGARTLLVAQELFARVEPLLQRGGPLRHAIVAAYSDYLHAPTDLAVPDFVSAARTDIEQPGVTLWRDALQAGLQPGPLTATTDDLAVMPYTSGTTGLPKGVMHSHRTIMQTAVASMAWFAVVPDMTLLCVAPMYHVTGMQGGLNGPLYIGCTLVLLPRWDRDTAARCVERYRVTSWTGVPTLFQDFFLNPRIVDYDLSSIRRLSGGGAAMPAAVAARLQSIGVTYVEGYGLTETAAATHINPPQRPKNQCLGIPIYGVDSRIVDPQSLEELPPGETGEIVIHGPQVMLGYWNRPEDTAEVIVEIDGKRFFRSGDLGRMDEDGYFFIVDRIKRMINASGFKVWPTEVEALMYHHPAIKEACIIGTPDTHRGETVKALVVLKPECVGTVQTQEIIDWAHGQMAAYKTPRIVQFVDSLPKSGSGKIMWRELQEQENAKAG